MEPTSFNLPAPSTILFAWAAAIFFVLWILAIWRDRLLDHHYIAIRYAVFMLREPDRTAFLNLWVKGHGTDIADRFPGFEIYREQYEKSRA